MKTIDQKLKNLIRFIRVTLTGGDQGNFPASQIQSVGGKTSDNITQMLPYGLFVNAPKNTYGLGFQISAQEEALVVIPCNPVDNNGNSLRPKGLKEGEVALCNVLTGAIIKLDALGNINISAKTGNLNINGDLNITVSGNATINAQGTSTIQSQGTMKVKSTGIVNVEGSNINLGQGAAQGIARLGDTVQIIIPPPSPGAGTWTGTITSASTVNKSL